MFVGLNNYLFGGTRHNLGSMALDYVASKRSLEWIMDKKLGGWSCMLDANTILFKPKALMNISGAVVRKAVAMNKIIPSRFVLVHDDLERKLGKISYKFGGSANGHNGVKSVMSEMGKFEFHRIRVGIDKPSQESGISSYVLSSFSEQEQSILKQTVFPLFEKRLDEVIALITK